jgi:hypothetical protein
LFNAKWAIFWLFHGKNKVRFDEMMMTFTLFWMEFYGASSLKKQSAVKHVAPFGHIILIPRHPVFSLTL